MHLKLLKLRRCPNNKIVCCGDDNFVKLQAHIQISSLHTVSYSNLSLSFPVANSHSKLQGPNANEHV